MNICQSKNNKILLYVYIYLSNYIFHCIVIISKGFVIENTIYKFDGPKKEINSQC